MLSSLVESCPDSITCAYKTLECLSKKRASRGAHTRVVPRSIPGLERHLSLSRFSLRKAEIGPGVGIVHSFTLLTVYNPQRAKCLYVDSYICDMPGPALKQSQSPAGGNAAPLHIYDSMNAGANAKAAPGRCALFLPPPALRRAYLRPPCASSGCQPSPPGPAGRLWGRRRWQPPPLPPPPPLPRRPPSRRYRSPVASTRGGAAR